jgi:hypothetical protein
MNGPGCIAMAKPIITKNRVSEIQNQEFEAFFSDKDNVTMSSYKVDSKTNLPLLYLKDNKRHFGINLKPHIQMELNEHHSWHD